MIITCTPLRISFVGGGTDLPAFYRREPGAVVSATINKFVYVAVNPKFDDTYRISYSITENVNDVNEIKNDRIRETIKFISEGTEITNKEIVTVSDVPSRGSGLGASSALVVGLLMALTRNDDLEWLAKSACEIEMQHCGKPIGKQDQYAVAYGGINFIRFYPDETVSVERICEVRDDLSDGLNETLIMLYLGQDRKEDEILVRQQDLVESKIKIYRKMAGFAEQFVEALRAQQYYEIGLMLDQNWHYKKQLVEGISDPEIDELYEHAKLHGAIGGKILGAGGGGFLLLSVPEHLRDDPILSMGLKRINFNFCGGPFLQSI